MSAIPMKMRFNVDLQDPLVTQVLTTVLQQGDSGANVVEITLKNGGAPAELSGNTVSGYFLKADGEKVLLVGEITEDVITVELEDQCYSIPGPAAALVRIRDESGAKRTILRFAVNVESEGDGPIIDTGNRIPSVEDLIVKLEEMEEAETAALEAAGRANGAAETANAAAANADSEAHNTAMQTAYCLNVTEAASKAATKATQAAKKIDNMTVSAVDGTEAAAEISEVDGAKHITFTLPSGGGGTGTVRSVNGVLPNEAGNVVLELSSLGKVVQQITKVPTADEEADATYTVLYTDGTTYQFTVPSGNVPVTSVNGKTGAVVLNADDVGALPADTPIPAKTSELTNDSGFIGKAVSDLTNYYLKSQTYTSDEINQRISAIPKFAISVVSALPTSGISETTIYLVGGGDGSDLYTEYIYVNGAWEILGSQRVDLTGYATETWVIGQLAGYQPVGDYATKSELPTVPTKLSQLSGDSTHRVVTDTEKAAWNGKLDSSELDAAVNDALAQAKASGEFDGAPGEPGYTPVRGTDYWTLADQEAIVQQVIAALGTPVFGTVDENKHITLSGHLADGTYTISFEDSDGFTAEVCTIKKGSKYTNQLDNAGYQTGHRLSSSGEPSAVTGTNPTFITGYIPVSDQSVVRLKNCFIDVDGINGNFNSTETQEYYGKAVNSLMITLCNSNQGILNTIAWYNFDASEYISNVVKDSNGHVTQFTINRSGIAYIRLTLGGDAQNAILTINEEITD